MEEGRRAAGAGHADAKGGIRPRASRILSLLLKAKEKG